MLPETVMIEVLSRLGVKSVSCCKCVCKSWRDLVSDPYFVHLHISRSHEAHMMHKGVSYEWPGTLKWVEKGREKDYQLVPVKRLSLEDVAPVANIQVGSVNGLVCCIKGDNDVYVLNPVLAEYMTLPRPPGVFWGFGYGFGVSKAGEYKVIWISLWMDNFELLVEDQSFPAEIAVYTLGTGQWRSLGETTYRFTIYERDLWRAGLYLNSHVYWLHYGEIYDFDLITETFQLFQSPQVPGSNPYGMLGVLKGNLCRISWYYSGWKVWVKKEETWYNEIAIEKSITPFVSNGKWEPLGIIEGADGTSFLLVYVHSEQKLMTYCLDMSSLQRLNARAFCSKKITYWNECLVYSPSFVKLSNFGSENVGGRVNNGSQ